jgi:hypothetical protein
VAVKKKATAKKVAKKAPAKKVAKKAVAKKSPAKKVAKKAVAKKATAKKVAKKAAPKKVAKKAVAKKAAPKKSTAKKAVARKSAVKKTSAKSSTASVVVPPVPTGASRDRVNVSTTPVAPKAAPTSPKPSAAPRQGSSKSVLVAVILGVAILAAIVLSQQTKNTDDVSAPAATESAAPEATESAAPEATESAAPAASGEAPTRFIGNWKNAEKTTLVLSWRAPAGDVTGYKVEIAANGGEWKELSQLPATQLSLDVTKTSDETYTSFRLSAIYGDGSLGTAKAFGFKGQFE